MSFGGWELLLLLLLAVFVYGVVLAVRRLTK
jgi:hypothetical protein